MPRKLPKPDPAARLELVVTYDTVPDHESLRELIEKAQELGAVERADFTIPKPSTQSLI
jgi:hypothetical protein